MGGKAARVVKRQLVYPKNKKYFNCLNGLLLQQALTLISLNEIPCVSPECDDTGF